MKQKWIDFKNRLFSSSKIRSKRLLEKFMSLFEQVPPYQELLKKAYAYRITLFFLAGLASADFIIQVVTSQFLTKGSLGSSTHPQIIVEDPYIFSRSYYNPLIKKNAFCPGCPIPDVLAIRKAKVRDCARAKPVNSSAKILGTIVLSNPAFSVAIIQEGASESKAFKIGDSLYELGKIFDIRRNRICVEAQNGKLNYIEMPEEAPVRFGNPIATRFSSSAKMSADDGIVRTSDTDMEIKRSFLVQKLEDPDLLFQAHAIPLRNSDNSIRCFKILSIVPGSVYEKLGLQVDDCLKSANGEALNSIAKAQQLYASARTAEELNLEVERGGSPVTFKYKVK